MLHLLSYFKALTALVFERQLCNLVKSIHFFFLQGVLNLALLDLVLFVLQILVFPRFGLFQLAPSFFDEAVVLDQFLLGLCNRGNQLLLLRLEILDFLLPASKLVLKLLALDHGSP